jgi:hypothetical protein
VHTDERDRPRRRRLYGHGRVSVLFERLHHHPQCALTKAQLAGCNATLDPLPETEGKSWHGHIYVDNRPGKQEGLGAQQI